MEPDFPGREIRKIYHKMRKTHSYHLTYPKNRGSLWHGSYGGKLSKLKPYDATFPSSYRIPNAVWWHENTRFMSIAWENKIFP